MLLLQYLKHEAEYLVNRFWDDICAVAKALLRRKTLTGDQVRDVINRRSDRLIQPKVRRFMKSYDPQTQH